MAEPAAWALPLAASLALVGLAAFVAVASKGRVGACALAFVLAATAVDLFPLQALGATSAFLVANHAYWANVLALAALPAYLLFVGDAVPTPLAWPFRSDAARWGLAGATALLLVEAVRRPESLFVFDATGAWHLTTLARALSLLAILVYLYTLLCAVAAYLRARPGTSLRRRSGLYLAAFGLYEVSYLVDLALQLTTGGADPVSRALDAWGVALLALVTAALLAYATLQHQLLGIDLKIKWTIRRGTVAASFVAVFFVVAEVAQNYLADILGWFAGGLAAGLLLFALRPLERAAGRLADVAMPGVDGSEEYLVVRRRELYRAAVESALDDGTLSARDRRVLARLADELGLGASEALDIETRATRAA